MFSAPFAAGVLFLHPPSAFFSLIATYIIGEMWIGVALTVVVELVPSNLRTSVVAYYLFIINIIAGNAPLAVTPLKHATDSLRTALYLLYPGFYLASSVLFLCTMIVLRRDAKRAKTLDDKESAPLLDSNSLKKSDNYGSREQAA